MRRSPEAAVEFFGSECDEILHARVGDGLEAFALLEVCPDFDLPRAYFYWVAR